MKREINVLVVKPGEISNLLFPKLQIIDLIHRTYLYKVKLTLNGIRYCGSQIL